MRLRIDQRWQRQLKVFGKRFGIAFGVLAICYALVFQPWQYFGSRPRSEREKLASLSSAISNVLLTSTNLSSYQGSNAATADEMAALQSQYTTTLDSLGGSAKQAKPLLSDSMYQSVMAMKNRNEGALTRFSDQFAILQKPLQYDPDTDIGRLAIDKDSDKLVERASAASNALARIARGGTAQAPVSGSLGVNNSGSSVVFANDVQQSLTQSADCFSSLANATKAKQTNQAISTRKRCITEYAGLKKTVSHSIAQQSFGEDFTTYMQQTAPPLIKKLDKLAGRHYD